MSSSSLHTKKAKVHLKKTSPYESLKEKWAQKHEDVQKNFWKKHKKAFQNVTYGPKQIAAGTIAGLMLLTNPVTGTILAQTEDVRQTQDVETEAQKAVRMRAELKTVLPERYAKLTPEQEVKISSMLTDYYKIPVVPELDGKRLNLTYGIIGAEQHLMRYPGDTIGSHFSTQEEAQEYADSGMAPGRGAWGYFVQSGSQMTQKDIDREKYYIAAQTFLSPGWDENVREMYAFFKYRKMLVVNADNGRAVVVVIGDAGPSPSTGKHLGGSPEVMKHLERYDGRARGAVLYYFIDDPEDKIPLGPIDVSL